MIELKNINKSFKSIELFKCLNVVFEENKKILIKGVNGSGKSVLLKMIVGYSKPTNGEIHINNLQLHKDMDFLPNAGISINSPEFVGNLTGIENLKILAKIRNIASEKDIYTLAKLLNFDEDIDKKYKNYSLGMKQKLRIIQALMDQPKYLILDEPFDALDQKSCEALLKILQEFVSKGNTLIYTTHTKEYEDFADQIYLINDKNLELYKDVF